MAQSHDLVAPSPARRNAIAACLVFLAYYLGSQVGFALTFSPNPISVLWPPNALLLGALLILPRSSWPVILLAAFPAHWLVQAQEGVPLAMILCWFVSNVAEAWIGAACVRRLAPGLTQLDSLRNVVVFVAFAGFFAPFVTSFLDASFVVLNGFGSGSYRQLWQSRFFANVLATLTIVPVTLALAARPPRRLLRIARARYLEGALLLVGLVVLASVVFDFASGETSAPALLFLPLPFLLWAALRFGPAGVGGALAVVAAFAIFGAAQGRGPLVQTSAEESVRSVQLFLIFVSPPLLALAAVLREREEAVRRLRGSDELFAKAFRSSPDAMSISRRPGAIVIDVNDRWESLFGQSRYDVIGRSMLDVLGQETAAAADLRLLLTLETGVRDMGIEARSQTGEPLQLVISVEPVEMKDERCFITTLRDITEQRRAELEARERRVELHHLSRVNMLGELSGALAHELHQPLAAILSNAQAAQRFLDHEPIRLADVRDVLDDIVEADRRAATVIRRLRLLLKRGEGQITPIDLNEVLGEVLAIARGDLVTRGVTVQTRLRDLLPLMHGDRVQLQQLFLNLVTNACEAMGENAPEQRVLTISTESSGNGKLVAKVSDRGPGLTPDQVERVFEPFVTTKVHGLGLGLAICRTIVATHGGRIWVESGAEGGASFVAEFPTDTDTHAVA